MGKFIKIIIAGSLVSQYAMADIPMPAFPGYGNCPLIDVNRGTSEEPKIEKEIDGGCIKTVNRNYNALVQAHNRANNIITKDNDGAIAPTHPGPNPCKPVDSADGGSQIDFQCQNAYNHQMKEFNIQMSGYQYMKEQKAKIENFQQQAIEQRKNGSATNMLSDMKNENLDAAQKQQQQQALFNIGSQAMAAAFAGSCAGAGATCQYKFLAASIGLAIMAAQSGKQASNHQLTALDACRSYNAMSSAGTDCGTIKPESDPVNSGFPGGQIGADGKCLSTAPPSCETNRKIAEQNGIDLKNLGKKGPSGFAGPGGLFKVNPDGTVTTKDGKTYKPSDFADKASMMAAGFTSDQADAAMEQLFGKKGIASKLGADAKNDLKALADSKHDFGSLDGAGGGTMTIKAPSGESNSNGFSQKDLDASKKRKLAGEEGLVRDFNGDMIGIASDDIFKMMNRRYHLKTAQDTFIGP